MVSAVGYAYPWDLDGTDPAAIERIHGVGVDAVAVAASYHSTRAATPQHPSRRLVEADYSACYVPVRPATWRARRLVPAAPTWTAPDAFLTARDTLAGAGLPVYAWTVLTHNRRLGAAAPDLTVRNAFGECYPYALCPSADEVVDYCRTLVAEIVAQGHPAGVVLEACGPLGVEHGGEHDKTGFAGWGAVQRDLLSLCWCPACRRGQAEAGLDPQAIAGRVRAALADQAPTGAATVEGVLGPDAAAVLARVRAAATRRLTQAAADAARSAAPGLRVLMHASARPWATGSFPAVDAGTAAVVDAVVGSCWDGPDAGRGAISDLVTLADPARCVGGYVRPDTAPDREPAELAHGYRAAGASEVHLYHLGLVDEPARRRLAGYAAAMRTAS
jgi:hypothetical protein